MATNKLNDNKQQTLLQIPVKFFKKHFVFQWLSEKVLSMN
jgi:hypothetical protein